MILDQIFPETLGLSLTQKAFIQSQDDSWSINNYLFPDYDLFICTGGAAVFTIAGRDFRLESGSGLLVPPRQRLDARKVSTSNFDAVAQHFELKHLGTTDFFSLFDWNPLVRFSDWNFVRAVMERYVEASRHPRPGDALVGHTLFRSLVLEFARDAWQSDRIDQDPHHGFVFRMAREIERGLQSEDIVNAVLRQAPCSADYAGRLFRTQFGVSPARYLTQCRIRNAADHLMAGSTVKEAAHAVGYRDELYFSRVFSKQQGMSPRLFQTSQGLAARH